MRRHNNQVNRTRINKIIVLACIGLMVVGIIVFSINRTDDSTNKQTPSSSENLVESPAIAADTLVIGDPNAPVTMIEYTDFKCPECNKYHQSAGSEIRKAYVDTGKVKIVFRPYPVFSEDGGRALGGSYCANQQGKFPEYHDAIFAYMWDTYYSRGENQKAIENVLTDTVMRSITENVGIDYAAYTACLEDPATRATYDADVAKAADDEIQGAPSFVIGGKKIVQNQPFAVFEAVIESQLR